MNQTGGHRFEMGPQLERVAFFSDAVFAIAMTLLVVDIRLPDLAGQPGGPTATEALRTVAPNLISFMLSFAVVALYWVGHHRIFALVRGYNGRVIILNLALLLSVVFIPFPTAFLSAYGNDPAGPVLYALANLATSTVELILWLYLSHAHFLDPALPARYVSFRTGWYLRAPIVFALSIPIAIWIDPSIAEESWVLLLVLGVLVHRAYRDVADLHPEQDET